jgi:hypothetical protein
MKHKSNPMWLLLFILILASLSCNLFTPKTSIMPVNETSPNSTKAAPISNLLGDEFRSETGGFSIHKIKEYDFKEVIGIVSMAAPNANPEVGPVIMAMGGLNEQDSTASELLEKARKESSALTFSKEQKVKVSEEDGWVMEVKGGYNGSPIAGRMVVVMVTPRQQFTLIALAPKERWEELLPIYEAALASITFFEAKPDATSIPAPTGESAGDPPTQEATAVLPTATPKVAAQKTEKQEIRQWATSARAASEYGSSGWSAMQAVGKPNVDKCGDNTSAWASKKPDSIDWIELTYPIAVVPTSINIYQSYNPSQVYEVDAIDTNGDIYILWAGEPKKVDTCPDLMTISLELDEIIQVQKIKILVDQSVLGLGWSEIDAVELVGTLPEGQSGSTTVPQKPTPSVGDSSLKKFNGWMAGSVYQGYLKVIPGRTRVEELNALMGLTGKRSTETFKPRPSHANTFIFDLKRDEMKAWIAVDTAGVVYSKSITPNTYPSDYRLTTVNKATYDKLDAIFKREQAIPYAVMANLLESPGFMSEQVLREDGRMEDHFNWYNANGDRLIGMFYDGQLTGIAGLVFLPK